MRIQMGRVIMEMEHASGNAKGRLLEKVQSSLYADIADGVYEPTWFVMASVNETFRAEPL